MSRKWSGALIATAPSLTNRRIRSLSQANPAENAEKILVGLFTTKPARDVRDNDYYRDQTTGGDNPLDPALRGPYGNKEKELPTDLVTRVSSPHTISSIPTETCYLPQGDDHLTCTIAEASRTHIAFGQRLSDVGLYLDEAGRPVRH